MWSLKTEEDVRVWVDRARDLRRSEVGKWFMSLDVALKKAPALSIMERRLILDMREWAAVDMWLLCTDLLEEYLD